MRFTKGKALLLLVASCLLLRVGLWIAIPEALFYADSHDYVLLANQIRTGDFSDYTGARTPVYPLFLLLNRLNLRVNTMSQSVLGILGSLIIFFLVWNRTRNPALAFLTGLFCSLALYKLYYERIIMSETLVTFLLICSVYLLYRFLTTPRRGWPFLVVFGLLTALAGLTRPLLVFLIPLFFIMILYHFRQQGWSGAIKSSAIFLIAGLILIGGWSCFNYFEVNYFGVNTLLGYNLSNHSGGFIEYAPEKYAKIRDIYIKHREAHLKEYGSHTNAFFTARPEIMEATGLSFAELSKELARMSFGLFVKHPVLYARSVLKAFFGFWSVEKGPNWQPIEERIPLLSRMVELFGLLVNVSFFLFSLMIFYQVCAKRHDGGLRFDLTVAAIVIVAAVLQALVEYGENRRYALPFHPLILYVFFVGGWNLVSAFRDRRTHLSR